MSYSDISDTPHTLRSHEIPISHPHSMALVSSNLEISESPTMTYKVQQKTHLPNYNKILNTQQEITSTHLEKCKIDNTCPVPVQCTDQDGEVLSDSEVNRRNEVSKYKEKQTNIQETEIGSELLSISEQQTKNTTSVSSLINKKQAPLTGTSLPSQTSSVSCASNPALSSQLPMPPVSTSPPQPPFYSFVILHAHEDLENARRVSKLLQDLGAGEGTTFSEEFEIPGTSPLTSLQDAVENCAYIILLLTKCFATHWTIFQSNSVLMNSIEDPNKSGTVIPFVPQSDRLSKHKIPLALKTLIPLDEATPVFKKMVLNTFKQDVVQKQFQHWRSKQEKKVLKQKTDGLAEQLKCKMELNDCYLKYLKMHNLVCNQSSPLHQTHQTSQPTFPMQPPPLPTQLPEFFLQNSEANSSFHPFVVNGQTPIIQINNAGNVQIGNQNSMNVQHTAGGCCGDDGEDYSGCVETGERCENGETDKDF
ncbi:TIR domain-containing adapter molecule 1 [Spea bombifrons]|uniref:TIR domain-containing adapter molecule 1 n=1 Tax=Spea bombifrons TaxID=233779 RepID=UPI00234B62BF|nr:TIR domain-containing adapter molecule 1 [Spea bombifrons]